MPDQRDANRLLKAVLYRAIDFDSNHPLGDRCERGSKPEPLDKRCTLPIGRQEQTDAHSCGRR
jgi:hypothetical protein